MSEIRIIHQPTVRLVGHQVIIDSQLDAFLADEGAEGWETDTDVGAQKLVECAGRLCYKSYAKPRPGGNSAYIGHIIEVGHGSVIEHAVYNFIITGVSRSFSHELIRHRVGCSYSQRSQRYCDENEGAFVTPPLVAEAMGYSGDDPDIRDIAKDIQLIWRLGMSEALRRYDSLSLKCYQFARATRPELNATTLRKTARGAARSVLPNACETQVFMTVNARAARNIIDQRADESADAEIRAVAILMLDILRTHSPNLFGDYETREVPGAGTVAGTPHRKV